MTPTFRFNADFNFVSMVYVGTIQILKNVTVDSGQEIVLLLNDDGRFNSLLC